MRIVKIIIEAGTEIISTFRGVLSFRTVTEKRLFWWSLLSFVFIGTCLVPFSSYYEDLCLGYDTSVYFRFFQEPSLIPFILFRHPFVKYILSPFICFNFLLQLVFQYQVVAWFMTLYLNIVMSYCVLLMYKILHDIIRVTSVQALLLIIVFISFGHVLLLLSVLDTYVFSMFFLLMTIYVTGCNIVLKEQPVNDKLYITLFLLTTGVTLSNGVKVGLSYLFTLVSVKRKMKWCLSAAMWLLIFITPCYLVTKGLMAYFHPTIPFNFYSDGITDCFVWISDVDYSTYLKIVYNHLLTEPLMLHTFNFADYNVDIDQGYLFSLFDVIVFMFYGLVVCGALSARRNRFTGVLLSFILVDVIIHLVFCFGLLEAQIYSGHWMFLFPLFIAGLFRDKRLERYHRLLYGVLIVFSVCFFSNNVFRLIQYMLYQSGNS